MYYDTDRCVKTKHIILYYCDAVRETIPVDGHVSPRLAFPRAAISRDLFSRPVRTPARARPTRFSPRPDAGADSYHPGAKIASRLKSKIWVFQRPADSPWKCAFSHINASKAVLRTALATSHICTRSRYSRLEDVININTWYLCIKTYTFF